MFLIHKKKNSIFRNKYGKCMVFLIKMNECHGLAINSKNHYENADLWFKTIWPVEWGHSLILFYASKKPIPQTISFHIPFQSHERPTTAHFKFLKRDHVWPTVVGLPKSRVPILPSYLISHSHFP